MCSILCGTNQNQRWDNNALTLHNTLENLLPHNYEFYRDPGGQALHLARLGWQLTLSVTLHSTSTCFYSTSPSLPLEGPAAIRSTRGWLIIAAQLARLISAAFTTSSIAYISILNSTLWTMKGQEALSLQWQGQNFLLPHCGMISWNYLFRKWHLINNTCQCLYKLKPTMSGKSPEFKKSPQTRVQTTVNFYPLLLFPLNMISHMSEHGYWDISTTSLQYVTILHKKMFCAIFMH